MNITVTFKEKKRFRIDTLVFVNALGHCIKVTSDSLSITDGQTFMRAVSFNDKYANQLGQHLLFAKLQAFDISCDDVPVTWTEIKSIMVEDGLITYTLPEGCFSKFKMRHIDALDRDISEEDFQIIAKYVREMDRRDNATDALENYDLPSNVREYLTNYCLDEFSEKFAELEDYSGEDEEYKIEEFIDSKGGIVYPVFISNKGTSRQICQTVPMIREHYVKVCENFMELNNGAPTPEECGSAYPSLIDKEGNRVFLKNVDEILL